MQKRFLHLAFLVSALMMLPACDWVKSMRHSCSTCTSSHNHDHSGDNSACCVSLNGKTAVTQKDFENKLNQLCDARPDIAQALQNLPTEQKQAFTEQLIEAMLNELLIERYAEETGLTKSPEYIKAAKEAHAAVETQLKNSAFQSDLFKKIEKEVTDAAAEKFYVDSRDVSPMFKRPPFIDKAGGVQTLVIEGLKESDAKSLAARAQKGDFAKLAKEVQLKVKDLGLVTPHAMQVDEAIRSKVLGYSVAPQVDVVKLANGKFAVIKVVDIKKDSFKSFSSPEVKEAVRSFMIRNELGKAVAATMEELKQKHNVVIHRDKLALFHNNAEPAQAV